jgi:hypothetical protein
MATGTKTGGRIAGTPNKRTQDLQQRLESLGVDPVSGLAAIAMDDSAPIDLRARVQMDLMSYLYPRRRALDVGSSNQQPVNIRIGLTAPQQADNTD